MPIAFEIPASGTVVNATPIASMLGTVDAAGAGVYTLLGTVSTDRYLSYENTTVYHHVRIKIAGSWVPNADMVGNLKVSESIDTHTKTMAFTLRGRAWSAWVTERTWTRAAVEIHIFHGDDPNNLYEETITGYVLTCSQSDEHENATSITCGDDAAIAERNTICYELAPFAGLTVGQIFVQVMLLAGFAEAEAPTGPVYTKPVQFVSRRPFEVMAKFIEPQGWVIRMEGSKPVAYEFDPSTLIDDTPSDTWLPNQWETMKSTPPNDVASRWVVRGTSAVEVNEVGIETTVTNTEIVAAYNPVGATGQQDGSGVITPYVPPDTTNTQVVSRIKNTTQTRAGKTIATITEEWGWYNPRAAWKKTTGGSYAFVDKAWQIADGDWVYYRREKFLLISRVTVALEYSSTGELTTKTETTESFHRGANAAVRTVGSGSSNPTLGISWIYGDNTSYNQQFETFGLSRQVISTYNYGSLGANDKLTEDLYEFYSPRARSGDDPPADVGLYILESGEGQVDRWSSFQLVETKESVNILNPDQVIVGTVTKAFGYRSDPQWFNGNEDTFDYGGGLMSPQESERWRFLDSTSSAYTTINADQVEVLTVDEDGRDTATVLGGPPVPRFVGSAWTELSQDEIEVVFEDATLEAWWGFRREVINHEFIQTVEEAERVYLIRKARALANKITVNRHPGMMQLADVVRLRNPGSGIYRKAWVVGRDRTWELATGRATTTYKLEAPLA